MADEANLRQIGHVDVIVLFDVIEHLPDPRETLALCYRQLNPGGIIVITTGDFGSMAAKLAGVRWRLMTPPQHLWFFTQESMRRMSAGLGLSMEHVDHPWKIVPASLIAFQLRRMLGNAPGQHGQRRSRGDTRQPVRRHACRAAKGVVIGVRFALPQIVLRLRPIRARAAIHRS